MVQWCRIGEQLAFGSVFRRWQVTPIWLPSAAEVANVYASALTDLTSAEQTLITECVVQWKRSGDRASAQLAENLEAETALSRHHLTSLLAAFAAALGQHAPEAAWTTACRAHQRLGKALPAAGAPAVLGRAVTVDGHASVLVDTAGPGLTKDQAVALLRRVARAGDKPNGRDLRLLRKADLGRYLIWATWNADAPAQDPFAAMARTRAVVRNCLGLGWCGDTEVLVLLSYDRPAVPLHRPTIGDAAAYSWFRPRADPDAAHGLTEPLDPTAPGVSAHPEVVHEVTSSATLRVPVQLAT